MTQRKVKRSAQRGASTGAPPSRAAQAAIRREQLLSTALTLFSEHGYAATSTRRIAEAAGVTEGLVFHYFGSKEALLLALAARQSTFAGRVLAIARQAEGHSARELLLRVADGYAEVSSEEAAFIGFLSAESLVNPALRAPIQAGTSVVLEHMVDALRARVQAGELRADAPLRAAMHGFFGGFSFFFAQHRDLAPVEWRKQAAEFAFHWADTCWRGLASASAPSRTLSDHSTKTRRRRS